jgi:uncharacterized protein YkwD
MERRWVPVLLGNLLWASILPAQDTASIRPEIIGLYLSDLRSINPDIRQKTLDRLKNSPPHLDAVLNRLDHDLKVAIKACTDARVAEKKVQNMGQVRSAWETHKAQKEKVGSRFPTPQTKPDFLNLVERHEAYFQALCQAWIQVPSEEKRAKDLLTLVQSIRQAAGRPAMEKGTVEEVLNGTPDSSLAQFMAQQDRYWRLVRQVYLWNRQHTPFASEANRAAIEAHNGYRLIHGLEPAELEEKLLACATGHTQEMQKMKYWSHTSPVAENKTWDKRIRNAGYSGSPCSENLATGSMSFASESGGWFSFRMWLWDPHHNPIVNPGMNQLGVCLLGSMASASYGSTKKRCSADLDPAGIPLEALRPRYPDYKNIFGPSPAGDNRGEKRKGR